MKRYGNLFEKIVSYENLVLAHKNARKGKSHYTEVKMVNENPEFYLKKIQQSLIDKTFTTSKYVIEEKFDRYKHRTIHKLPYYPDRIIQHALVQVCESIWNKTLIRDTFQSLKGRGTFDGFKRVNKAVKTKNSPKYCLKIDIEKYYPSVNNDIFKTSMRKKIKCKDTLWLIDDIIDSTKGLPIGNYTSQYFGNLYLSDFDWWIKQEKKVSYYYRYCDDMIFLHDDKHFLHTLKHEIINKLLTHNLKIKPNHQVFDVDKQGLDFIGFIFRQTHTLLRPRIAKGLKTKAKIINKKYRTLPATQVINSLMSYWGWIKFTNSKNLWASVMTKPMRHIIKEKQESIG